MVQKHIPLHSTIFILKLKLVLQSLLFQLTLHSTIFILKLYDELTKIVDANFTFYYIYIKT